VITAAVLALLLLGQPVAGVWCAVRCHSHDVARMPSEDHCRSEATREPASRALTGEVALCTHDVAIAFATIERHQLVRPTQADNAVAIEALLPLAGARVRGVVHNQRPPGSIPAPLPLRI